MSIQNESEKNNKKKKIQKGERKKHNILISFPKLLSGSKLLKDISKKQNKIHKSNDFISLQRSLILLIVVDYFLFNIFRFIYCVFKIYYIVINENN